MESGVVAGTDRVHGRRQRKNEQKRKSKETIQEARKFKCVYLGDAEYCKSDLVERCLGRLRGRFR